MRKCSKIVWAILLVLTMVLTPMSTVYAESGTDSAVVQDTTESLVDGSYSISAWSFDKVSGTSRRTFTMSDTLVVREGVAYVTLTVDSVSYTYVLVNGVQYDVTVNGETSTFEIPTELGKDVTVSLYSSSMETLIDYTMNVNADVPVVENPGDSEEPKATWQDGYYIGTGTVTPENNYPKEEYDVNVGVKIENGKIVAVNYVEEPTYDDGNISYMIWAMTGHHTEGGAYKYLEGTAKQIIDAQSVDNIDIVSGATWTSRAIKDSVQAALLKAEKGEKDTEGTPTVEPEKEINTPDKEGTYTVDATAYGFTLLDTVDVQLKYKDGKMTAVFTTTMSPSSYDYLYMGTDDEAYAAGKDTWLKPVAGVEYVNSSGKTRTGNQYEIPVESLNQEIKFIVHARSSGNWFYRAIKFDSASLVAVDAPGQDTPGQDTPGQDTPGQDTPGQDIPGQDTPSQDKPGQDTPSQGTQNQNTSNQDKDSNSKDPSSDQSVNTGDTTGVISVWAVLCMLSVGCAGIILAGRKKNHI